MRIEVKIGIKFGAIVGRLIIARECHTRHVCVLSRNSSDYSKLAYIYVCLCSRRLVSRIRNHPNHFSEPCVLIPMSPAFSKFILYGRGGVV